MSKRIFQFLLVTCLVAGTSSAAEDPFVGKWKLDPSKSKLIDLSSAIKSSRSSRCLCPSIFVMQAAQDRFGDHT
jgi:predicted secreted protein